MKEPRFRETDMERAADEIYKKLQSLADERGCAVAAIDGRCASGKTTLAALLQKNCGFPVIHMDHFFLQPQQRTRQRMNEPGGNVDKERFLAEVIPKLRLNKAFFYRPFDCGTLAFAAPVEIEASPVYIIEGSYSCHPELFQFYDLSVFLTVNADEQLRRIALRGGEPAVQRFRELWIPLEERYFSYFSISERCDMRFST